MDELTCSNADIIQDSSGNPGMDAFRLLRAAAEANGIQDMSLDEIYAEIRRTREGIEG